MTVRNLEQLAPMILVMNREKSGGRRTAEPISIRNDVARLNFLGGKTFKDH